MMVSSTGQTTTVEPRLVRPLSLSQMLVRLLLAASNVDSMFRGAALHVTEQATVIAPCPQSCPTEV